MVRKAALLITGFVLLAAAPAVPQVQDRGAPPELQSNIPPPVSASVPISTEKPASGAEVRSSSASPGVRVPSPELAPVPQPHGVR